MLGSGATPGMWREHLRGRIDRHQQLWEVLVSEAWIDGQPTTV